MKQAHVLGPAAPSPERSLRPTRRVLTHTILQCSLAANVLCPMTARAPGSWPTSAPQGAEHLSHEPPEPPGCYKSSGMSTGVAGAGGAHGPDDRGGGCVGCAGTWWAEKADKRLPGSGDKLLLPEQKQPWASEAKRPGCGRRGGGGSLHREQMWLGFHEGPWHEL